LFELKLEIGKEIRKGIQTQQANQTRPENPNSPAHPSPAWAQPFLRTGPLPQCLQPGPAYARVPSLRKPAPCGPLSHGPLSPCRLSPSLPGRTHRSGSSPSPCWPPLFRSRRAPSLPVAPLRPVRALEAHWPASQGLSPSRSFPARAPDHTNPLGAIRFFRRRESQPRSPHRARTPRITAGIL